MKRPFYCPLALLALVAITPDLLASSAHDDASQAAYSDGWDDGDNGGIGFGPWSLSFDGDASALNATYGSDPHFIDGVGVGPLGANLLGDPAFGLTADSNVESTAEATRSFSMPWLVGQTFSVDIDGSALEGSPRIGNLFELIGADGVPRYSLRTALGSNNDQWIANGSNTSIDAGEALRVSLTLNSADTFSGERVVIDATRGQLRAQRAARRNSR